MKEHLRRRGVRLLLVTATILVATGAGLAYATIPDGIGVIHACRNNSTGAVRVIDTQAPQSWLRTCSSAAETALDFYAKSGADAAFLGKTATAADSDKLDGLDSSAFAGAGSSYTKGESDARFLGANAKAADSDKLDGIDSTGFIQGRGHSVSGFVQLPPGGSRPFELPGFGTIQFDCSLSSESLPQARISFFTQPRRTLAAAVVTELDASRSGGFFLVSPDTQSAVSSNPLDVNRAWIAQATITGGSPTVSAFGSTYGQNGNCAIQFHAAVG